jgi:hypothetical protein
LLIFLKTITTLKLTNLLFNKNILAILIILISKLSYANLDSNKWNFAIEFEKLYPIFTLHDESFDKKLHYNSFSINDPSFAFKSTFYTINSPISFTIGCNILSRDFEINYKNPSTPTNTTNQHRGTIYSFPLGVNYKIYRIKNTNIYSNLSYEFTRIQDNVFTVPYNIFAKVDYVYKGYANVMSTGLIFEQLIYKKLLLTFKLSASKQLGKEKTSSVNSLNRYTFALGLKYLI